MAGSQRSDGGEKAMIRILLIQPRPRNSTDPVFWAMREKNRYYKEIDKIREEFRREMFPPLKLGAVQKTCLYIYTRIGKLNELISIGMYGKIIDDIKNTKFKIIE